MLLVERTDMAQIFRTFRVFVSSTFSDLKKERNALWEKIFPCLRHLETDHLCRFQANVFFGKSLGIPHR